jgi:hypothetical protein
MFSRWFFMADGWELVSGCKVFIPRSTQRAEGKVMRERCRNSVTTFVRILNGNVRGHYGLSDQQEPVVRLIAGE